VALTDVTGGLLPTLNDTVPHRLVPVLCEFLVEHAGAGDAGVLVADYELRELRRLNPRPGEALTLPVEGSDAGQSFVGQVIVSEPGSGGAVVMPSRRRPT